MLSKHIMMTLSTQYPHTLFETLPALKTLEKGILSNHTLLAEMYNESDTNAVFVIDHINGF